MHPYRSFPLRVAMAALACGPGAAFADDGPPVATPPPIFDQAPPRPQAMEPLAVAAEPGPALPSASTFGDRIAVDIGRLAAMRGGDDINESNTSVDGSVHDNTADHVVSGSNFISDEAFANASGLNTVIQNSGSNVLIQNGMSIQVIFANPGQ